jgi:hypothetical protein
MENIDKRDLKKVGGIEIPGPLKKDSGFSTPIRVLSGLQECVQRLNSPNDPMGKPRRDHYPL